MTALEIPLPRPEPQGDPLRPVWMHTQELPHTVTSTAFVDRICGTTVLRVHPGSPTPQIARDIAMLIRLDETPAWLRPFGYRGQVDRNTLAAIAADPVRVLGPIAHIPAHACNIPSGLHLPGQPHLYTP